VSSDGPPSTGGLRREGFLNMTNLALHFSRYVNGVAMRHGEVSQDMFPQFPIHAITNDTCGHVGIAPVQILFDREIPNGAATTRIWLRRRNSARGIQRKRTALRIRAHQEVHRRSGMLARRIRVDHRLCAARRHVQARGLALQGHNRLKYIAESMAQSRFIWRKGSSA